MAATHAKIVLRGWRAQLVASLCSAEVVALPPSACPASWSEHLARRYGPTPPGKVRFPPLPEFGVQVGTRRDAPYRPNRGAGRRPRGAQSPRRADDDLRDDSAPTTRRRARRMSTTSPLAESSSANSMPLRRNASWTAG